MKILKTVLKLALFAAIGGLIGFLAAKYGGDFLPKAKDLGVSKLALAGLLFGSIPLGLFISVLIHELGHLLFGISAGMRPVAMIVGPLCWRFSEGKSWPKLSIGRGISGGITVCIPKEKANLKTALAWLLVGGPFASLLLASLCFFAFNYASDLAKIPLAVTVCLTIFLGVYNLIPNTVFGLHTDGARLLAILKDDRHSEEMIAQFLLSAHMHSDRTPATWPQDKIDVLTNAKEFSPEWRAGHYYNYMKIKFSKDWPSAKFHLMQAADNLGDMPQVMKNSYRGEVAAFRALYEENFTSAAKLLKKKGKGLLSQRHTEAIYQAIIHIADNELELAKVQLQIAAEAAPNAIFKGTIPLVMQDIKVLETYLAAKQAT